MALKLAIVASRKPQKRVADEAGMGEVRLSHIVNGHGSPATDHEKAALARVLRRSPRELFDTEAA